MARVAWGITGAGSFLFETFDVMEKISDQHTLSCYLSGAGERVVRIYGLWEKLKRICEGGYYKEIILESEQGPSSTLAGRFLRERYAALIVSPASANTVAKIVSGIADSLVTNAVSQAEKAGVPVLIVPTDQSRKKLTTLPPMVDREVCDKHFGVDCEKCLILDVCPYGAIVELESLPKIDLTKCEGCRICVEKCPYGAVSFGGELETRARRIDLDNVRKLRRGKNFIVLKTPKEIPGALKKVLKAHG